MAEPRASRHAEAVQLHRAGKLAEAEAAYRAHLAREPADADSLHQLGALLIQRSGADAYEEALKLVRAAIQLAPSNARFRRSLGVVHEAAKAWGPAADAYAAALDKRPNDVRGHMDVARVLKALDRPARAAEALRGAIRLEPDHPQAHFKLGQLLKQQGKHAAAAEAYRQHLRIVPGHAQAAFWLAALTSDASPAACPSSMVATMFDQYADHFDEHLTEKLQYRTPGKLMDCILQAADGVGLAACPPTPEPGSSGSSGRDGRGGARHHWSYCLDLGCGTGLMGPLLRRHCRYLAGVDLSSGMVGKARERGCYDELAVGEVTQYLCSLAGAAARTQQGPDLLTAADVFVYIGELRPVLDAAAAVAADGALFAFTTELLRTQEDTDTAAATAAPDTPPRPGSAPPEVERAALGSGAGSQQRSASEIELSSLSRACPAGSGSSSGGGGGSSSSSSSGAADAEASSGFRLQTTGRYAHARSYLTKSAEQTGWRVVLLHDAAIRQNAGQPIIGSLAVLQLRRASARA